MNSVEVDRAFKYFGSSDDDRTTVLAGLSLTVAPSSIYALLGASGCGKTTLLSCILGIQKLDSGRIKVLGYQHRNINEISPMSARIGYMPQETALLDFLTVKEIVHYFGNIAQMKSDELYDRYEMLKKLLDLPNDRRKVENCSGGEQRRISFACSLIHNPDLLILDEPTVGVDPILREKIWNFMWHATRTSKLAIIITTHYIEEARQADRCGLMRNGILLAEDTPQLIIERCQCDTLEEAFFKLCLSKESETKIAKRQTQFLKSNDDEDRQIVAERSEVMPKRTLFNRRTMKALIWKNFIQTKRQIGLTIVLLLIPVLNLNLIYFAIGGDPLDLKIAVVNREISNSSECNSSIITAVPNVLATCELKLISCRFLDEIPDDVASMIFYQNFSEAYDSVKRGRTVGIMEFFANFSQSQHMFLSNEIDKNDDILNGREIKFYMDQTNLQTTLFLRHKLYEIFHQYSRKLMTDCKYQKNLDSFGMQFLEPIYGNFRTEMRTTIAPPLIFIMLFITSACTTVILFLDDRRSGIWNRSLLMGVDVSEMILAQVLVHMSFLIVEIIEVLFVARYVLNLITHMNYFLISLFFFLLSVSGFFFGMFTSCIFDDVVVASLFYTGFCNMTLYISGILWPLEGLPSFLKFSSNFLPFTHPAIGIRDIISKGYNLSHFSVQLGLISEIIWIIALVAAIHYVLRFRKFSRNS